MGGGPRERIQCVLHGGSSSEALLLLMPDGTHGGRGACCVGWGCDGLGVGEYVVWAEQRCNGCGMHQRAGQRGREGRAWIGEGRGGWALVLRGFQEVPMQQLAPASQPEQQRLAG